MKRVSLELGFLGALFFPVKIGNQMGAGKLHSHIWDLRLSHTVIVKLHGKRLASGVCTGKCIAVSTCIRNCQMSDNKLFSSRKIWMFRLKEPVYTRCFRSIVAHFRQFLSIPQLGDLKDTIPRTVLGWLNTIGCRCNISKRNGIFVSQIRT